MCIVLRLSLSAACGLLEAPNFVTLRPWLEVDLRPLQIAAMIMCHCIKENGDSYGLTKSEREDKRRKDIRKEVKYIGDKGATYGKPPAETKVGWSTSTGLIESLIALEMREIFDTVKKDGPTGDTVAETMVKMGS